MRTKEQIRKGIEEVENNYRRNNILLCKSDWCRRRYKVRPKAVPKGSRTYVSPARYTHSCDLYSIDDCVRIRRGNVAQLKHWEKLSRKLPTKTEFLDLIPRLVAIGQRDRYFAATVENYINWIHHDLAKDAEFLGGLDDVFNYPDSIVQRELKEVRDAWREIYAYVSRNERRGL